MLTLRLWRSLSRRTPLTAVYRRLHLRRIFIEQQPLILPGIAAVTSIAFIILPILLIFLGVPLFVLTYIFLLPYALPFILVLITGYGLLLCMNVSAELAREHERGVYDVLCSCPPGRLGVHWAYVATWLSRHSSMQRVFVGILVVGSIAVFVGAVRTVVHPEPVSIADKDQSLLWFAIALGNIASLWITYLQTLVLSSLTAMLTGTLVRQAANARLYSDGIFLSLQVVLYVLISFINSGFASGNVPYTIEQFIVTQVLALLIAYTLREGANWLLWKTVVRTLSASPSELDPIMHGGI